MPPHPTGYGDCVEDETRGIAQEDETRVVRSQRWSIPDPVQLGVVFVVGVCLTLTVATFVFYFADLEVVQEGAESSIVSVPNVRGQSTPDAESEVQSAGLEPESDYYEQSQFWRGFNPIGETVIATQNPDPGTAVEAGTPVGLGVK